MEFEKKVSSYAAFHEILKIITHAYIGARNIYLTHCEKNATNFVCAFTALKIVEFLELMVFALVW